VHLKYRYLKVANVKTGHYLAFIEFHEKTHLSLGIGGEISYLDGIYTQILILAAKPTYM